MIVANKPSTASPHFQVISLPGVSQGQMATTHSRTLPCHRLFVLAFPLFPSGLLAVARAGISATVVGIRSISRTAVTQDLPNCGIFLPKLGDQKVNDPAAGSHSRSPVPPDLSVVIVNWNTRRLLADCLSSLPEAAPGLSLEIWVVDNGSTDGSQAMLAQQFPQVKLIANDRNRGFAAANNQALRQARGRVMLLLNSDTVACPGSLARLLQVLEQHPRAGIVGARLLNRDGSVQNSIAPIPSLWTELGHKGLLRLIRPRRYRTRLPVEASEAAEVDSVIGACMLVRAQVLEQAGLLDEGYFFFLEETDWCLRAQRAGWAVLSDPQARVYHLQGGSASGVKAQARIEYWRSRYRFFDLHYGWTSRAVLRIGLLAKLAVGWAINELAGLFHAKAKQRARVYRKIGQWHLAGRPVNWGLQSS